MIGHVLVTGSAGFLGRTVTAALGKNGYRVQGYDLRTGQDVLDLDQLRWAAAGAVAIVHLAAPCSARMFSEAPEACWTATIAGMRNVLACARCRVVLPSSGTVYGDNPEAAREDSALPIPANLYANAKLECERLCLAHVVRGGDVRILRIFTGYGPDERLKGVYASPVMQFLRAVDAGRRPAIYGDGRQTRDFIFVTDIAECVHRVIATSSAEHVFNVGTGTPTSFLDLLEMVSARAQWLGDAEFVSPPAGYVGSILADTTLLSGELGYRPTTSLEVGLDLTFRELRRLGQCATTTHD